jgi:hypothetical protein
LKEDIKRCREKREREKNRRLEETVREGEIT